MSLRQRRRRKLIKKIVRELMPKEKLPEFFVVSDFGIDFGLLDARPMSALERELLQRITDRRRRPKKRGDLFQIIG